MSYLGLTGEVVYKHAQGFCIAQVHGILGGYPLAAQAFAHVQRRHIVDVLDQPPEHGHVGQVEGLEGKLALHVGRHERDLGLVVGLLEEGIFGVDVHLGVGVQVAVADHFEQAAFLARVG